MALDDTNAVVFEGNPWVKKVILNRPRKLNTLTYDMISKIKKRLEDYENDFDVKLLIVKGNGKAFCAGADMITIHKFVTAGHWSFGASYFNKLFNINYLVATYKKPLVVLIDGIAMGGAAALSMLARFKIVTENTIFSMPEAAIGAVTGGSCFLSRLPGYFGEYLGLTGAQIDGAEMLACGLATHFVLSKDLHLLENTLGKVDSSDTNAISQLISKFMHKPDMKQNSAYSRLQIVNKCFSGETVESILLALENQKKIKNEKWIVDAINSIKSSSPISLKVSLRLIREGRRYNLEECSTIDYTTFCHVLRKTVSCDIYEGLRAKLLEKDEKLKWQPSKLGQVTEKMVDRYFEKSMDEEDWKFLKFPQRSNLIDIISSKL